MRESYKHLIYLFFAGASLARIPSGDKGKPLRGALHPCRLLPSVLPVGHQKKKNAAGATKGTSAGKEQIFMKYTVEITETLQKSIEVEASSPEEAESLIRQQYDREEIVLDADSYISTEIQTIN